MTNTLYSILQIAKRQLEAVSDSPRLDAEYLLLHLLDKPHSYLYSHPEEILSPHLREEYGRLIERRLQREPVAYIIGKKAFWSLELVVNPATLIPRPETELLVELALQKGSSKETLKVIDLGTGSGAIALALAKERPNWMITATDYSLGALQTAQENAKRNKISNVTFIESCWWNGIEEQKFDLIISNPPYIASDDPHLNQADLRYEPLSALASGPDGLDAVQGIIDNCIKFLHQGTWLVLEHGYHQAQPINVLLKKKGFQFIEHHKDLAGIPRAVVARQK